MRLCFHSEEFRTFETLDVVSNAFKDVNGPSVSTAIKAMAMIALVFADFFVSIRKGGGAFHVYPNCH